MAEEATKEILGIEMTEEQLVDLAGMFSDPGYKQYAKILKAWQQEAVDCSLGYAGKDGVRYEEFCVAQANYGTMTGFIELPEGAKDALKELRQEKKEALEDK